MPQIKHPMKLSLIITALFLSVGGLLVASLYQQYQQSFYPGVQIDGMNVAGMPKADVTRYFQTHQKEIDNQRITIFVRDTRASSTAAQIGFVKKYQSAIDQAFMIGKNETFSQRLLRILTPRTQPQNVHASFTINDQNAQDMLRSARERSDTVGEDPTAELATSQNSDSLTLKPGKTGYDIDMGMTMADLLSHLDKEAYTLQATVFMSARQLSDDEIKSGLLRAKKFVGKQIILQSDGQQKVSNDQEIISLLAFPSGFSEKKVASFIMQWKKEIEKPSQEAVLIIDHSSQRVTTFVPPSDGVGLDADSAQQSLLSGLSQLETSDQKTTTLPYSIIKTHPTQELSQTNSLGIMQRIGLGESRYQHSIPGRIHNVKLTAERINNTLVPVGAEFSFNKTLGDVSAATGFDQAYIIKDGRTQLGDGGGVCQVSTTLFRALLDAGLPITKRHAHSYRVSYYELNSKPGVDATVYGGDVDLRFINDTGYPILIHTETDSQNLYMKVELYGTSDGRTAEIVDHKVYDITPAPPPLYQFDASLPHGRVKQIDFAAAGAKASFKTIVKDKTGAVIRENTYFSNYKPWQAIYLRGP